MSIVTKLEELLTPKLESLHYELVDLQYVKEAGKMVVRVFIDKEGGITLDDCATMSDTLGAMIDTANLVDPNYVLEVSSPGLDRVLKKERDFIRFSGHKARITVFAPIDGQRNFLGKITAAGNGQVAIEDTTTNKTFTITIAAIARARLEPEI